MNYTISEHHNGSSMGDDIVWSTIKISDLTHERLESILDLILPWYRSDNVADRAEHESSFGKSKEIEWM